MHGLTVEGFQRFYGDELNRINRFRVELEPHAYD